jgi:hypothetical protein
MASQARQLAQGVTQPTGRKNLIINGAMQVAQRGTLVENISGIGYKALDRMRYSATQVSTARFTQEQVADAPDGFSNSLKFTTTTAQGGIPANGRASVIDYRIEAQDLQHLKYGTSDAKKITLSFWVKSSLTGLTTVGIYAPDGNRSIAQSYTINSANTWEYKTLTFDGDTGGTINNDNGLGLEILFQVAAGSDFTSSALQTSWGDSSSFNDECNGGNTFNLVDTLNATFQITGIQLEVGSTATDFEHRSYGEELALCQRYFLAYQYDSNLFLDAYLTNDAYHVQAHSFPVTMRIEPSNSPVIDKSDFTLYNVSTGEFTLNTTGNNGFNVQVRASSTSRTYVHANGEGYFYWNAEL